MKRYVELAPEEFRQKAQTFYTNAKHLTNPMPYSEEAFITTVTAGYQLLYDGDFPTIEKIMTLIKSNENFTRISRAKVTNVFRATEIGGGCWKWVNYCWKYVHELRDSSWVDYIHNHFEKDFQISPEMSERHLNSLHRDFVSLLFTIEYL